MNNTRFPRRPLALLALLFASLIVFSGCGTSHGGEADTEWRPFQAQMVWVPRGMHGFWGLQTRGFGRIHPLREVSESFHENGLKVRGELLLRPDMASIRAWGRTAEIRNLERAD